jgi:amidohydrolase
MAAPIDIRGDVGEIAPRVVALRRALHEHPELAFEEVWTAATLAARMRSLGLDVVEGLGGTGVLATLAGSRPGKTLLVRADIDALPMAETTGASYASKIPNRNHSCGHDAHAAVVSGVAEVLLRHRSRIAGRVAFVFQPADEPMRGAKRMIEDGLLDRARPDVSLSLHVLPMAKAGEVVVQSGPIWASWDTFTISIEAPAPARDAPTHDVARVAAEVTAALYALAEREGRAADPVAFRVHALAAEQRASGGEPAHCAVQVHLGYGRPSRATIETTLAVYDNGLRTRLLRQIEEIARAIAVAAGATIAIEADYAIPAVVNEPGVTAAVRRAAASVVGEGKILGNWRNRFADDVSLLMQAAPGCLLLLGTANPEKGITEIWHRPGFDIDEDTLAIGVEILSLAALDILR